MGPVGSRSKAFKPLRLLYQSRAASTLFDKKRQGKTIVKGVLLCWSTLVLFTFDPPLGNAQDDAPETRPVVVASFSGYAELKRNLLYLGTLSGNPGLAAEMQRLLLPSAQAEGLAGLDEGRPWGALLSVTEDGLRFPFLVFLPVDDFGKLLGALASNDEADEEVDGIYAIERESSNFFVRRKGDWACVARQRSALADLPDDPLRQLRDLEKQYDLALSVNVQNIPAVLRGLGAGFIKQGFAARLRVAHSADDEQQRKRRSQIAGRAADAFFEGLFGLDRITVGLNIDPSKNRACLDLEVTALPGGNAAKQLAAGFEKPQAARQASVFSPDAIFSVLLDRALRDEDKQSVKTWMNSFRNEFPAMIDGAADLSDDHKANGKKLAASFLDLLDKTVEQGRIFFGLIVTGAKSDDAFGDIIDDAIRQTFPNHVQETIIGAGRLNFVAFGLAADGAKFEEVAMQVVSIVAAAAREDQPKLNVDQYKGRRFHTFSVMAPQTMRAEWPLRTLRNLLGNPVKIVLAFGDDTFFAAVGEKGADAIKQVIDQSLETPGPKRPPLTASLALSKLWNSMASQGRDPMAAKVSEILGQSGNDHVNLTVEPIAGGLRCRIEGEGDVARLLASGLTSAAGAGVNLDPPTVSDPTSDGTVTTTTTTSGDDGATVTTTRTESGDGGRTSRREVTVTRRSSSAKQPSRPNGGDTGGGEQQPSESEATLRTWSSKGGRFQVRARFVEMQGDLVRLEKENGARVTIEIDKLSETDQKLAREFAELAKEENPFVVKGKDE
jgi:hypothetical protein